MPTLRTPDEGAAARPSTYAVAMARIGLPTDCGDCSGLNAVIRAAVGSGLPRGDTFLGFRHGRAGRWRRGGRVVI